MTGCLADSQPEREVTAAASLPVPQHAAQSRTAPKLKPAPVKAAPKLKPAPERTVATQPTAEAPERTVATQPTAEAPKPAPERTAAQTVTTISGYLTCNQAPQPCIDGGNLTLYGQQDGVNILAGHNYQGYQWLSQLPVGRRVVVSSGSVAGTYQVTGHMRLNRQSGPIPSFGGADLVLQSCEGSGTGFSLLKRVS
mgnify:CR=1 FL=1